MNENKHMHMSDDGRSAFTHEHDNGYITHIHERGGTSNGVRVDGVWIEMGPVEWALMFFAAVGVVAAAWLLIVVFWAWLG